jgi:hypothetical protein
VYNYQNELQRNYVITEKLVGCLWEVAAMTTCNFCREAAESRALHLHFNSYLDRRYPSVANE